MRKITFLITFFCAIVSHSQVGIGTTTPSDASMLEISGVTAGGDYRGFMPPRVPTTTDRDAIPATSTDIGLMVFVQSTNCLQMWNGTNWEDIHCLGVTLNSEIQFTATTQSLDEDAGGISFEVSIANPSASVAIDVTITPASFTDIDETMPTTITIPAGATSYTASNVFTITDDSLDEGIEMLDFTLSAPTGGLGIPTIGANATQTLTINDNDAVVLTVWINEFHYDNTGGDVGEFIEIAGVAGTDVSGYSIALYGDSGTVYATENLVGTISDQDNGFGTLTFPITGIQNGANDGFALVDNLGAVLQFLSYEGVVTATAGPANTLTSIDVGVVEPGAVGESLQLTGLGGTTYSDFTWSGPSTDSPGTVNTGQGF